MMMMKESGVELKSIERDRESGACRVRYDPETLSASMAVVAAMSKLKERHPTDLDPIEAYVDTDALDGLFRTSDRTDDISVTFSFMAHEVSVGPSGSVTIATGQYSGGRVGGD